MDHSHHHMKPRRVLVIGFGNVYRRDDGVGLAVVNALRRHLGQPELPAGEDGMDALGASGTGIDSIALHQLLPELAELLAPYELVVFVDAHVESLPQPILEEPLEACFKPATVSHILHPCALLALAEQMHGRAPQGILLSLRGHDFDFGEGLSPAAQALVPAAVARILELAGAEASQHA